jgi:hypothetical protein
MIISPSSAFLENREGGVFIPQSHVWHNGHHKFSDDVIFASEKRSIFQLVILVDSIREGRLVKEELEYADLEGLSGGLFSTSDATYIIHDKRSDEVIPDEFVFAMSE